MSKHTPNTEAITNELHGASLYFQRPPAPSAVADPFLPPTHPGEVKNERTIFRADDRTNEAPPRQAIRHTFDIYQDQLIRLQKLQIAAMMKGRKKPKLGKMVQKALDLYLTREEKKSAPDQGQK